MHVPPNYVQGPPITMCLALSLLQNVPPISTQATFYGSVQFRQTLMHLGVWLSSPLIVLSNTHTYTHTLPERAHVDMQFPGQTHGGAAVLHNTAAHFQCK